MSILLVRHGETASNAARVVQTPDTPLSERGVAQADRLAQRLEALGVVRILSSDHRRALMTAERVQVASGSEIVVEPLLQERNFGEIRGRSYTDVGVDIFAPDYAPPGGETWEEFHARVDRAWQRVAELVSATAGNVAVVTHGLVCFSLAERHLALPEAASAPLRWGNASLTVTDAAPPWTVRLLNCTRHLDGEDAADATGSV